MKKFIMTVAHTKNFSLLKKVMDKTITFFNKRIVLFSDVIL